MLLVYSLAFASIIFSCKSTQYTSEKTPDWITSAPISSQYYIGIGSASKEGNTPDEYIQRAKNSALKDLASSISVNISGTSVLSVFESDTDISNSFMSEIKASTEQYLEGYEQVGSWEDKYNYWVYYRLSRAEYADKKLQQKQEALKTSWTKYQQSVVKRDNYSFYEAWTLLVDAMAGVKPYVNENTEYNTGDSIIDLGSFLYSEML
ncbi:MAG TPA: LPP20 family lipoprotein, partial [Bacteroidales bacterium]|nr:LPP20 family lipoprotein [Bacteroidales bacterium]